MHVQVWDSESVHQQRSCSEHALVGIRLSMLLALMPVYGEDGLTM